MVEVKYQVQVSLIERITVAFIDKLFQFNLNLVYGKQAIDGRNYSGNYNVTL